MIQAMNPRPEVQLPLWSTNVRALPNALARSALFTVANVRKGDRKNLKQHPIASVRGVTITYTGEELRQDDADVFLQLLHIARGHPLGSEVRFIASHMLERLKWTHNSESYDRLEACVVRLQATSVRVTVALPEGDETFYGSLLPKALRSRKTAKEPIAYWRISLDPDIVALFGDAHYSLLEWDLRLSLPPLAKWLHTFYSTHAKPWPYSVASLHQYSGSETKLLKQFRYKLREALGLLIERGFLVAATITEADLVVVERA